MKGIEEMHGELLKYSNPQRQLRYLRRKLALEEKGSKVLSNLGYNEFKVDKLSDELANA